MLEKLPEQPRLQPEPAAPPTVPPNLQAWHRFRRNRLAVGSACFLVLLSAFVLVWPLTLRVMRGLGWASSSFVAQHEPDRVSDVQFSPPTSAHWFGTDVHGRDLFARVVYGARISLAVAATGTAVSLVIGVLWGAAAGYIGGKVDALLMRTVDVLYSMPSIIFVIVLITTTEDILSALIRSLLGGDSIPAVRPVLLVACLGAVSWLNMARIVRGQVLSLKHYGYVEASRALGAGTTRILFRHIIPNTMNVVIVYLALTVPAVMLYESFLSFLGLGIQPPMASWGTLIAEGAEQLNPLRIYWWLLVFPGGAMVLTLLALNLAADGLRDAWDVRA